MNLLLESLLLSILGSLIGSLIFWFILQRESKLSIAKRAGIVILIAVLIFLVLTNYQIGNLKEVPNLGGHSQAEADNELMGLGLIPDARYEHSTNTVKGYVIPLSQNPVAGTLVREGTKVSFAVSLDNPILTTPTTTSTAATSTQIPPMTSTQAAISTPPPPVQGPFISIDSMNDNDKVDLVRGSNGIYSFSVEGSSSGIPSNSVLLLWVEPVNPPGDNVGAWYLQKDPIGIQSIMSDGSWSGRGQLGNAQYPPHNDDTFSIMVTVVDLVTAQQLKGQQGEVTRMSPSGSLSDKAINLKVNLK
jgi:hypothetical protein